MGLLGSLFGGTKEHAPLDSSHPVMARIDRDREVLEGFARRVQDKLELVPGEHGMYVFIGKPPKTFGIVWFHDGQESNFKTAMKDHGLTAQRVQILSDELREAYTRTQDEPRFTMELGGRTVLVTPSPTLENDVHRIISSVIS